MIGRLTEILPSLGHFVGLGTRFGSRGLLRSSRS